MVEQSAKPTKPKRLAAGARHGVGDARYALISSAAQRITEAMRAGFWLEATTLVESILAERMEKRVQWLYKHLQESKERYALERVKDGFANLGPLISALLAVEKDADLKAVVGRVEIWRRHRNSAIHEMVKLGDAAQETWDARLERAHQAAQDGIEVLRALDTEERRVSHAARARPFASATCPDALSAIGQPDCPWCKSCEGGRNALS